MKKNLITIDLDIQVMRCRVCTEVTEIPSRLMRDQDGLQQMHEYLVGDHRECAEDPGHPEAARRNREFRKRVQRETRRFNDRQLAAAA